MWPIDGLLTILLELLALVHVPIWQGQPLRYHVKTSAGGHFLAMAAAPDDRLQNQGNLP
jgi:hypothetical protein